MAQRRKNENRANPFPAHLMILAIVAFLYFAGELLKPLALSVLLLFRAGAGGAVPRALVRSARRGGHSHGRRHARLRLGAISYVVGRQLTSLANRLPDYQGNIERKLQNILPAQRAIGGRPSLEVGR